MATYLRNVHGEIEQILYYSDGTISSHKRSVRSTGTTLVCYSHCFLNTSFDRLIYRLFWLFMQRLRNKRKLKLIKKTQQKTKNKKNKKKKQQQKNKKKQTKKTTKKQKQKKPKKKNNNNKLFLYFFHPEPKKKVCFFIRETHQLIQ